MWIECTFPQQLWLMPRCLLQLTPELFQIYTEIWSLERTVSWRRKFQYAVVFNIQIFQILLNPSSIPTFMFSILWVQPLASLTNFPAVQGNTHKTPSYISSGTKDRLGSKTKKKKKQQQQLWVLSYPVQTESFLQGFCSACPGQCSVLVPATSSHRTLSISTNLLALWGQELSFKVCTIHFLLLL